MTLVMFIWKMDLFKIFFVKDNFERKNRLCEIHFLTKFFVFNLLTWPFFAIWILLKIVFTKDDF
jgi:hypothetical protein